MDLLRKVDQRFSIVVVGVNEPDDDSFAFLRFVSSELKLPAIVVSEDLSSKSVSLAFQNGCCDYLSPEAFFHSAIDMWQHLICHDLPRRRSDDQPSSSTRPVVWSDELHDHFQKAVNQLGFQDAVPYKIWEIMKSRHPELTQEIIATHLQWYKEKMGIASNQRGIASIINNGDQTSLADETRAHSLTSCEEPYVYNWYKELMKGKPSSQRGCEGIVSIINNRDQMARPVFETSLADEDYSFFPFDLAAGSIPLSSEIAPEIMRGNKEIKICHGPMSGLPEEIVFEILVRISSVKTIARCKSVCKSWRGLISDSRFAECHLARSKICILVRDVDKETTPCLLEDEDGFHSGHCMCRPVTNKESCEICLFGTTAITELKISVGRMSGKIIQNTCNGFLCLYSEPDPEIVVSNPITGEFILLPDLVLPDPDEDAVDFRVCGLGLDSKTGQYSLPIPYSVPDSWRELVVLKAALHVLGTDLWRQIATPNMMLDSDVVRLSCPTFFDGALHWVYTDVHTETYRWVSFDLGSERLRYSSLQSLPRRDSQEDINDDYDRGLEVVVLGGGLCVYHSHPNGKFDMCTISSVSDSLPEWISHNISEDYRGDLQLICSLDDGALLMYHDYELIYHDLPRGSPRFHRLRFPDLCELRVVAFTPSFLSLKDIVKPGNTKVLDLYSREKLVDEDACSVSDCE